MREIGFQVRILVGLPNWLSVELLQLYWKSSTRQPFQFTIAASNGLTPGS